MFFSRGPYITRTIVPINASKHIIPNENSNAFNEFSVKQTLQIMFCYNTISTLFQNILFFCEHDANNEQNININPQTTHSLKFCCENVAYTIVGKTVELLRGKNNKEICLNLTFACSTHRQYGKKNDVSFKQSENVG